MVRYLPFLISLGLSIYALISCIQTRKEDVPYLPKLVWVVLIVFVPYVGPIVWILVSWRSRAAQRPRPVSSTPKSRPVAPDDDPDFLASLDRYRDPRTTVRPPSEPKQDKDDKAPPAAGDATAKDEESGPQELGPQELGPKELGPKDEEITNESDDGKP